MNTDIILHVIVCVIAIGTDCSSTGDDDCDSANHEVCGTNPVQCKCSATYKADGTTCVAIGKTVYMLKNDAVNNHYATVRNGRGND